MSPTLLKVVVAVTTTFRSGLKFYKHSYDNNLGCLFEQVALLGITSKGGL